MKVITWNINSVRLRAPIVKNLLESQQPDILFLQETKVEDALFPLDFFHSLGYTHTIFSGEKSYNGVAIISKLPLENNFCLNLVNDHKRHISAQVKQGDKYIELHNFYIPAGGDEPDREINPKFGHKLDYCDAITDWFKTNRKAADNILLAGDLNIAPYENDVWSHKQLLKIVSHTPIEVEKLTQARNSIDFLDIARKFVPETEKLYSWWSYRNRDWEKSNRGRRLDHIWVTGELKQQLKNFSILREARNYTQPSDHVPVIVEI
jgi:exodeoxyribonuclease-3